MSESFQIVTLSGGVGGARFTRGLLHALERDPSRGPAQVTVIANTGDDMWMHGLRICPDLDTMMYTLGGGISDAQGWGRDGETFAVAEELGAYGLGIEWFTLGDRDIGTHLARTELLSRGLSLTEVTRRLAERWNLPIRLLPMSDTPVETHVRVREDGQSRDIHFEQWWVKYRAQLPAERFTQVGVEDAVVTDEARAALAGADLILIPPSNPVVSVGTILTVPGMLDAVKSSGSPVVGVSPIIAGAAVRGMADACLQAIGVGTQAAAVARHYRDRFGILDGWLVDDTDAATVAGLEADGIAARAVPLWMTDVEHSADIADAALALGDSLRR